MNLTTGLILILQKLSPEEKIFIPLILEELELKHKILTIDTLQFSEEKQRKVIGKLDRAKLKVLYEMNFGNYVPVRLW